MKIGRGVKPGMLVRKHGEWLQPWNGVGPCIGAYQPAERSVYIPIDERFLSEGPRLTLQLPARVVTIGHTNVRVHAPRTVSMLTQMGNVRVSG